MKQICLAVLIASLGLTTPLFAATYWVSTSYGNNTLCNGTADQGVPGGCSPPNCACAKASLSGSNGALSLTLVAGDIIKVGPGQYPEEVVINSAGITVEAKTLSDPPVFTGQHRHLFDHGGWTDLGSNLYRSNTDSYPDKVRSAYILDGPADYENKRIALMLYDNLADLYNPSSSYSTAGYYGGPGIIEDSNYLYVRLEHTPQLTKYEGEVFPLFAAGSDPNNPNNYKIAVTLDPTHTIRITASGVTIRGLQIEPARIALDIRADDTLVDNVTVWGPSEGWAIANDANASDVTIKHSRIYSDIGHWIAWTDCKVDNGRRICNRMKPVGIGLLNTAHDWTIYGNHIRGFHDGLATNSDTMGESFNNLTMKYNRIENIHDDAFEIEALSAGETMGLVEIYGNFIENALTCASIGQDSAGTWNGPIHFLSNICVLMRPHHVNRTFGTATWNAGEGLRYGHQYAMKYGYITQSPQVVGPDDLNTNVYNNTFVLHDSHDTYGLGVTNLYNNQENDHAFNNVLLAANGRVGTSQYFAADDPNTDIVNYNLYFTYNNPGSVALLDTFDSVEHCCESANCGNRECQGLDVDPYFGVLGFGCIATGNCISWAADSSVIPEGVDANAHLQTFPSSWIWGPESFSPHGTAAVCGRGIETIPDGLPERSVVDPTYATVPYTASDMGAVPCGDYGLAFDYFPMNQAWKTLNLASNDPPVAEITAPIGSPTICKNSAVNLCGTFEEPDGAPPFEFLWEFFCPFPASCGAGAPANITALCPGNVTFATAGTYDVEFTVKDRWGALSDGDTRQIIVEDCPPGGGGGCSNCNHCICNVEN